MTVRIGTRASNLAMWQANTVRDTLALHGIEAVLVPLTSTGDRSLGGHFTRPHSFANGTYCGLAYAGGLWCLSLWIKGEV